MHAEAAITVQQHGQTVAYKAKPGPTYTLHTLYACHENTTQQSKTAQLRV
jgi:hypothetical protein